METEKDKLDIQKAKERIVEQIEETKKLDLGLDADGSSEPPPKSNSKFTGFIDQESLPPLDTK